MKRFTHDQRVLEAQRDRVDEAARAGVMRQAVITDNPIHRALFSLPPIRLSEQTGLTVPELPAQRTVTGDREVDAVIWLRQVIGTGQPALIAKAKKAAKKIKTPLKDLEKRYTEHLARTGGRNLFATMASMGFADLEGWETRSIELGARRQEARARFGDALFENTASETFAQTALAGVKVGADQYGMDDLNRTDVDARFDAAADQRPATLTDCLVELKFWNDLYWLRNAVDRDAMEFSPQSQARKDYAFRSLGLIPPRSTEEAHEVLQYLIEDDRMNWNETPDILRNLMMQIGAGTAARTVVVNAPENRRNANASPVVEVDEGGAGISAPPACAEAVLLKLDGYMSACGYDTDHPWRREIRTAMTCATRAGAPGRDLSDKPDL